MLGPTSLEGTFINTFEHKVFQINLNDEYDHFEFIVGEKFEEECYWIKTVLLVDDHDATGVWMVTMNEFIIADISVPQSSMYVIHQNIEKPIKVNSEIFDLILSLTKG